MIAKIAALAISLMLLTVAVAVAGPPAAEEIDDSTELALTEATVVLYVPTFALTIQEPIGNDNAEF